VPIVCVGQLVADVVVRPANGYPASGTAQPVEELQLLSGGCAGNTAAVLAKLGADVRLAAVVGRDALGDAALADLKAAGVALDTVVRDPETPTSAAIVLVAGDGQRSFFYRPGGNERLSNCHLPDATLRGARVVHVGGAMKLRELDLAELMTRAKFFGCLTTLDTDWDTDGHWMRKLENVLPRIDYLLTNEEEAAMLTGSRDPRAAAGELLARGPRAVVVKRGEHGAIAADKSATAEFPAYAVAVSDTTCAGDCFAAGFLLGLREGRPLHESVRLGNAAGALCTTQISHRAITSLDDLHQLMKRNGK
jgi:sugar/nucleoside kinase (ribokinase family)